MGLLGRIRGTGVVGVSRVGTEGVSRVEQVQVALELCGIHFGGNRLPAGPTTISPPTRGPGPRDRILTALGLMLKTIAPGEVIQRLIAGGAFARQEVFPVLLACGGIRVIPAVLNQLNVECVEATADLDAVGSDLFGHFGGDKANHRDRDRSVVDES